MWEWLERLFGEGFMPHGHCYLWSPSMVWTQVLSNLLIGMAYVSIALTLVALVRRIRNMPFAWAYSAFGVFIISCGFTHLIDIATVWHPIYWFDATVRVVTAGASVATAFLIVPLVPKAARLAESARVSEERARELASVHAELEKAHAALAGREKAAVTRAEKSEEQFRELIDNLPELAWTADAAGNIDFYNRRWFEYTGTTHEAMTGWGWESVHDPAILPLVTEKWKHSLETGESFEMEFPLRGANGEFRWFLTRVRPLRDSEGKILRWFGVNTDIDERRKIREELARTLERERAARTAAETATRAKDEFLAAISHELRTPLTAILGWARLLTTGQVAEEKGRRALEIIERNALAQAQMVEDLLDISRIVSGKLRLEVKPVAIAAVVDAAIESLRPAISAREIRLQVTADPLAGSVAGDAARLQQVMWNVIGNAVKFSPKGGRVDVSIASAPSNVEITVTDWGAGIASDFLPYVFDQFRQADGSSTRAHGGLGIGLAITKHLVELHGGNITAASEGQGHGATFTIVLPLGANAASTVEGSAQPPSPVTARLEPDADLAGIRVLVVDDEKDARELFGDVLTRSGAVVTLAASAAEAMPLVSGDSPDVIISDIGMPGQNGLAFIEAVRKIAGAEHTPAAALTAFARAEDRRRSLDAGFQMHVVKPVEPSELVAVVATLAKLRRAMT